VLGQRAGEVEGPRVPTLRRPLDGRPARVGEAQEPGDLVKCLAGRVIQRAAQSLVAAVIVHQDQLGVPARDDQHQQREGLAGRVQRGQAGPGDGPPSSSQFE